MEKIKKFSRVIRAASQIVFWGVVALMAVVFLMLILPKNVLLSFFGDNARLTILELDVPLSQLDVIPKTVVGMMLVFAFFPFLFGLHHFIRLFRLYEQGKIFSGENIAQFRIMGWVLILYFPLSVSIDILKFLLYAHLNQRMNIVLNFSSKNFGYLIVGVAVLLIARIMAEAKKLQDEQDLIL